MFKKTSVMTKTYWENTLLSINIVIDDRLTCNVNKAYMYMILVVSIHAFPITIGLLIQSSQEQIAFLLH